VCISGYLEDFIEPPRPTNKVIKGFNHVYSTGIMEGTIAYRWEDDDGKQHIFQVPNSVYIPGSNVRLLSPQHWAKHAKRQARKNGLSNYSAGESTDDQTWVLQWGINGAFKRTIKLDRNTNVATFKSTLGYNKYMAFCVEKNLIHDNWEDTEFYVTKLELCPMMSMMESMMKSLQLTSMMEQISRKMNLHCTQLKRVSKQLPNLFVSLTLLPHRTTQNRDQTSYLMKRRDKQTHLRH